MAEGGSWDSIAQHGLLSTSALLDLFGYQGEQRSVIESRHRPESITIEHPEYGTAVIRDQKPMDDVGLIRSLQDGLSPTEWYRLLNSKVFFWATRERLGRMLNARPYRNKTHDVLTIDTASLVERYQDSIVVSPMNSGATRPYPHPRGLDTFCSIEEYPYESWERRRKRGDEIAEIAVDYGVRDIIDFAICVDSMRRDQIIGAIWVR